MVLISLSEGKTKKQVKLLLCFPEGEMGQLMLQWHGKVSAGGKWLQFYVSDIIIMLINSFTQNTQLTPVQTFQHFFYHFDMIALYSTPKQCL